MPSLTTWTRLEPRARDAAMREGLQARVHDPLWLLGRQWQLAEFQGEDAGSAIEARLRASSHPLTRYHPGRLGAQPVVGAPYDPAAAPLEAIVEREPRRDPARPSWRHAAELGLHFARLLRAEGAGAHAPAYLAEHPLAPTTAELDAADADSQRYARVVAGRVVDGERLLQAMRATLREDGSGTLPPRPAIPAADEPAVKRAAVAWLRHASTVQSEPAAGERPAWIPERMEYAFAVSAATRRGEAVLAADEYVGGHLDWHAFDEQPGASLGAQDTDAPDEDHDLVLVPAPVDAPGLPAPRFWEFEDAHVDLGAVEAGPVDLARLLFLEFALVYGNDWFLLPVELPVGTVFQTRSLVVTDTFGVRTLVLPASRMDGDASAWRMFQVTTPARGPSAMRDAFLLAPALPHALESPPLEDVHFLRDEMANMAWAVERRVEGRILQGFDRARHLLERAEAAPPPPAPAPAAPLVYKLQTDVPENWIPLLPVPDTLRSMRLQRAALARPGPGGATITVEPAGRILEPGRPLRLYEEEVPRAGIRVIRAAQLARWTDGSTHLWVGRKKSVGRGEGSSGLAFDVVRSANAR